MSNILYEHAETLGDYGSFPIKPTNIGQYGASTFYRWSWKHVESKCTKFYGWTVAAAMFRALCKEYGYPVPTILNTLDWKYAGGRCSMTDRGIEVDFPRQGATGAIVLHEFTHYAEYMEGGRHRYAKLYANLGEHHHSNLFVKLFKHVVRAHRAWL